MGLIGALIVKIQIKVYCVFSGFKCWSCDDIDINEELAHIANRADVGEEGPEGTYPW